MDRGKAKPYGLSVDVEFDDAKDAANLRKHGVSLAFGVAVLRNAVGEMRDERRDYGEIRLNAFGYVEGRLFACTYTRRGNVVRLISVRKASRQEQRRWQS